MGRRKRRSKHHRSNNNKWKDNSQVSEQRPNDPDRFCHLICDFESRKQANKRLFQRAKSKVCRHFKDCTVRSNFGDIKLQILHLMPRYPHIAPELILLRVIDKESILLGRIDRFDPNAKRIYIRDIEDDEISFHFECIGDVVKPGRFISIKNPQIHIFEDETIGFGVEDEKCVIFIDIKKDHTTMCVKRDMECAKCKRSMVTLKKCTGCYKVSYCSKVCQKAHWSDHRKVCKPAAVSEETVSKSTKSVSEHSSEIDQSSKGKEKIQTDNNQTETESSNATGCKQGLCVLCKKDAEKKCSRCKKVFYCSKQCQKEDWKTHKHKCQDSETEHQQQVPFNPWFSPFSPFQQSFLGENLSAKETTTDEKFHQAVRHARARFPFSEIVSLLDEVPSEHFFFRPQTNYMLVAFIPRYHHYRERHCIYIQDKAGEEIYVAFYLDFDNPFPYFSWPSVRPGRFIAIDNPCIHYFADGSVGLRLEDPSEITFIDV